MTSQLACEKAPVVVVGGAGKGGAAYLELVEWRHDRETARGERRQGTAKHHVQDATQHAHSAGTYLVRLGHVVRLCWSHVRHKR
jgi:hypothetical protein